MEVQIAIAFILYSIADKYCYLYCSVMGRTTQAWLLLLRIVVGCLVGALLGHYLPWENAMIGALALAITLPVWHEPGRNNLILALTGLVIYSLL